MASTELLAKIEGIDNMLLACLNERASACRLLDLDQVRAYELGMDFALRAGNEGPLTDTAVVWLFDTIRDATERV